MTEILEDQKNIEQTLAYMGVRHGTAREVSYTNWFNTLKLIKDRPGEKEENLLSLARSYVGVDERYLRQYLRSCKAWGTIRVEDGQIYYVGVPKGVKEVKDVKVPKGKPFPEYEEPPPTKK